VQKGIDMLMKRDTMRVLHEGKACRVHYKGPPRSRNDCNLFLDKILCNRYPLKHEGRTRVRDEKLYELVRGTIVYRRKT